MGRLLEAVRNPEPFEEGTQIWLDPDRAELVLKTHLDENIPGGSKSQEFIDEAVEFICKIAPLASHKKIIDLGCGPGLYSKRLAIKGYEVVGVDFNQHSLDFAVNEAKKAEVDIDYRNGDITNIDLDEPFDLALLIYQLYGVFDSEKRRKILQNVHKGLKPGGLLLMDVLSDKSYDNFEQNLLWGLSRKDSLFSDEKHLTLYAALKYPEKVTLSRNIIVFDNGDLVNYNYWNQNFSMDDLEKEVMEAGFKMEAVFGDVNGESYTEGSECFAVLLRKE